MTFKQPKPQKEPGPRGDIEVGDHLYVHHQGQPYTGVVRAHGRHGCTVEIDGQHHKVKWSGVLGHKKRAQQRYEVLDHGEDGMLVQDASGKRRFIKITNDSKENPMVAKSFDPRRSVLFFKSEVAAPAKPEKKPSGDWTEAQQGAAPAQAGQHVAFRNGEFRGHGRVAASGEHGVTVQDQKGGQHRVLHDQITHHWSGDGEPSKAPPADEQDDDDAVAGYDGKVALPGELVAELLKTAPRELRAKAAEFLREKSAGDDVEKRAVAATPQPDK